LGSRFGNYELAAPGKNFIRRRTIRTPGALGLFQAAAGRVTVLSRQYTYPMEAFMGRLAIWQLKTSEHPVDQLSELTQLEFR
jgi:hypothetical protein